MQDSLKITSLNHEDIKFLKRQLRKSYFVWLIFSLFSVVFPCSVIYAIISNKKEELHYKVFYILLVLLFFGLWIYFTIRGIIDAVKEQQNLLLQQKIEGSITVLEKQMVTIEGNDSDTDTYQIKMYSEVEEKHKNIWIDQKYYDKIQVGDVMWIEYYLDCNYIKTLVINGQNIKSKIFR